MRKLISILCVLFFSLAVSSTFAQEVIENGSLKITVTKLSDGAELSGVMKGDMELLDTEAPKTFFVLTVSGNFLTSLNGWDSVLVSNDGENCDIIFSNPHSSKLPDSLNIVVTIKAEGNGFDMGLSVSGLQNSTLTDAHFPYLNIKADGNDYFFIPRYSGKLIKNPVSSNIDNSLNYPRGWSATMQFCAYYNSNYGIYLGTHDPKAASKDFIIKVNNSGGIRYENNIIVPNNGISGNNWQHSGVFRFEVFEGDWYEAAHIYKNWASKKADFWPQDSPQREARQRAIGDISAWLLVWGSPFNSSTKNTFLNFKKAMNGVPLGLSWYKWMDGIDFDAEYPFLMPEQSGMTDFVNDIQDSSIYVIPYTNGRLFDQSLSQYPTQGKPSATKNANGTDYTQGFNGRTFSVMCPTQAEYQDLVLDVSTQLANRIGCAGVYFDQVCAAGPTTCMDTTHHHTLAGGTFWRDGYRDLFEREHDATDDSNFVTTEGACDYLADEVDGFLTLGWMASNMVPAFQAVYGGKVQLLTTSLGYDYDASIFYCKLSQLFVNGIQPGWFSTAVTSSSKGYPFVKSVVSIRYKLRDFLSYGTLMKPLEIDRSGIPTITTTWKDHIDGSVQVTLSALQYSYWKNKQEDETSIIFTNASMDKTINFTLNFDGESNGLHGNLMLQKITGDSTGDIVIKDNSFSMDITMSPLEVFAYKVMSDSMTSSISELLESNMTFELQQNYPNPFNPVTEITYSIPNNSTTTLIVYDLLGRKVAELVNKQLLAGSYQVRFDASRLPSGLYFYRLTSGKYTNVKKMMLIK